MRRTTLGGPAMPLGPYLRRGRRAFLALISVLALGAVWGPSVSRASLTLGRSDLPPATVGSPNTTCVHGGSTRGCLAVDDVVPGGTVTAPSTGMLVSWSVRLGASTQAQNIRIRVVRPASNNTFTMIASGPLQPVPAGAGFYTFPLQLPISAGDRIAMDEDSGTTLGWRADAPGARSFEYNPSPDDGGITDAPVFTFSDQEHNLSAVLVANNSFSIGAVTRNKKKGTATVALDLPNPGDVTASGNGVKAASASRAVSSRAVGVGPAQLLIKAKGKKKRKLNETGKVKLNVAITYTPTAGDPNIQSVKVKLKKRL